MNILTANNISKSYGEKKLFKNISFTINNGDKVGLIGINGTGKSTLLKIISGYETADLGDINIPNGINIEYLDQNPKFDSQSTVLQQIFKSNSPTIKLIKKYQETLKTIEENPKDGTLQKQLLKLTNEINNLNAWDMESQVKTVLTKLGVTDFNKKMGTLSGGQRKRVALASALLSPCDLLILDEPTNHMDNKSIDWLEDYLKIRKGALLMVTHDRYFLDRVVNKTMELDHGKIYTYTGNYSQFIEKKIERKNFESAIERKKQNLYKKELKWIKSGVKARGTKQKARIQRFEELKNSKVNIDDSKIDISVGYSRLGKKIIQMKGISKSFGKNQLIKDFSYIFLRNHRIGIIGDNGTGKSTFLNLIAGKLIADEGIIDIGKTVKIGYFAQTSENIDENLRAIEYIRKSAEYINTSDGNKISASQMMERFLFSNDMQWTYISRLSGGEKRRLYLLKILMNAPNVLILDEPTNDLDIDTLNILEDYIDEFDGAVISVSHDRYFLDRTCDRIFFFEGSGYITEYTGNYSDFIAKRKNNIKEEFKDKLPKRKNPPNIETPKKKKLKFSYKEKFEYERIDSEIELLENELSNIEDKIQEYSRDFEKLQEFIVKKDEIEEKLLFKMERQEYLNNLEKKIRNFKA
ncbi:ABC-F family ATP-binding cassette domain-containing protein [Maledivibacter halophilus]|uniref:ATP-binding cassette, subfamily F, uup n=1 Tax=Maledivibacter halophilus TaxID=36842 RepID=A0A1T5KK58_9FIRM|nr:ABC-F family ATP-binding cassette domain-containing protein [Maledivibacter halophilus]SKC64132.1 ATP-binding cassette, subfamily F, uup [Maledivibacter halophilus]